MLLPFYHLAIALSALPSASASAGICYYPNGNSSSGLNPCNTTAPESHCCRSADVCLTNKLCFSPGLNAIVRRGCTDKTWSDPACPQFCLTGDQQQADVLLTLCDTYNVFCCGQDEHARACCNSRNETIRLTAAEIMTTAKAPTPTATIQVPTNFTAPPAGCKQENNRSIGLGAALGVTTIALAALSVDWWNKRSMLRSRRPVMT